jgi:hypothetical protein
VPELDDVEASPLEEELVAPELLVLEACPLEEELDASCFGLPVPLSSAESSSSAAAPFDFRSSKDGKRHPTSTAAAPPKTRMSCRMTAFYRMPRADRWASRARANWRG